jgi:CubicO group peptidase (beta-lactamase class C family)
MTGYGAKVLCSGIFLSGRAEQIVIEEDLSFTPVNLVKYKINYQDSSVTSTMFGLAARKAIYRKGLGTTLIVQLPETTVRSQLVNLPTLPLLHPTDRWPLGDTNSDSVFANVDTTRLQAAILQAFKDKDSGHLIRTRAMLVIYNGKIIAERYAPGISRQTRLTGWSMTKSITGALIGVLVKDGRLNEGQAAPVPEWKDAADKRHAITIKNLLQQSSGLDFEEDYSKYSDATRMLFMRADMGAYTAARPLKSEPGTVFYYSSGNSNILSRIIRHTLGDQGYHAFPYQKLFFKLGMFSAVLEPDASGTFVGSSYCYASARDWGRFGLFYLNDGVINNERLLPEGWVKKTTTPGEGAKTGQYGYQFWLNRGSGNSGVNRKYPHLPADMYYADGFEGQNIFIFPSQHLVVVRLGMTQHGGYEPENFLRSILQSIH